MLDSDEQVIVGLLGDALLDFGSGLSSSLGGPSSDGLLLEDGDYLLLEDGSYLLLE